MQGSFTHLEILGPRASLERWLASVQEVGVAHLADALHGLEGRPGIGRPAPTAWEREGAHERAEALRALRAIERALPPSRPAEAASRPRWIVGFDGGDAPEAIQALAEEARALAGRLGACVVDVEAAERGLERAEARSLGLRALLASGARETAGRLLVLPRTLGRTRPLARSLSAAGWEVGRADGPRVGVLVARAAGGAAAPSGADHLEGLAAGFGAEEIDWPAAWTGRPPDAVAGEAGAALAEAEAAASAARAALARDVAEVGPRARLLLDGLEDGEVRARALGRTAATQHVAALRVYTPTRDEARLREALDVRHGRDLVVRVLAPGDDAPAHARRLAGRPFEALLGWRLRRLGALPLPVLLAPVLPPALAWAWGDLGLGLVFLLVGAVLGIGARIGSARRDTAVLAQATGVAGLLGGILFEGAFGAAGVSAFGEGWGLVQGLGAYAGAAPAARLARATLAVVALLGGAALLAGTAVLFASGRRRARAGTAALMAATALVGAGLLLPAVPGAPALPGPLLALGAAVVVLVRAGARTLLERTALDLVGIVRLVGVGGAALTAMSALCDPDLGLAPVLAVVFAGAALSMLALAMIADAAYAALGVPYDLALGGQRLTEPYAPFGRRFADEGVGGDA